MIIMTKDFLLLWKCQDVAYGCSNGNKLLCSKQNELRM